MAGEITLQLTGDINADHLQGVEIDTATPTDGQVLSFDEETQKYIPSDAGSGDMTKAVYDTDDDGTVEEADHAATADLATEATHAVTADEAVSAQSAQAVAWDDVTSKPSSFTPESHNHDDLYYTQAQSDAALAGKSDTTHNHDSAYSAIGHEHTGDEITSKVASAAVADTALAADTTSIHGIPVSDESPEDGEAYLYNGSTERFEPGLFTNANSIKNKPVLITDLTDRDILEYDEATDSFKNVQPTDHDAVIGIPATEGDVLAAKTVADGNVTEVEYITLPSFGDIVTHDVSEFATSAQGGLADTAIQAADLPDSANVGDRASDVLLDDTDPTDVIDVTPAAQGNFLALIYYRVITALTNVTINVTYNDGTGAQTNAVLTAQPSAVGSYSCLPVFINATTGAHIKVTATAGTANQVYVSASVVEV